MRASILGKLNYMVGQVPDHASEHDWFMATAYAVRDRIIDRWAEATRRTYRDGRKRVYYFSLEFLIGRLLFDAMSNLGITAPVPEALAEPCLVVAQLAFSNRQVLANAGAFRVVGVGEAFHAVVSGTSRKATWLRTLPGEIEGRLVRGRRGLSVGTEVDVVLLAVDPGRGFIDFARADTLLPAG